MQYKNKSGFSIILALGFTLLMSSIALYLIEYIVPFSRNVKGIENASQAYYQAYGGIEDSLFDLFGNNVGHEPVNTLVGNVDFGYRSSSNGTSLPLLGKGSSRIDPDWNIISQDDTIQLSIGDNRLSSGSNRISILLRVPDFDDGKSPNTDVLDTSPNDDVILWQLSSPTTALSTRSGSFIRDSDINAVSTGITGIHLWSGGFGNGIDVDGNLNTFSNFYNTNCGPGSECILKMSIMNPLTGTAVVQRLNYPYLEYRITTDTNTIPSRFSQISSEGRAYNFRKSLDISVLQQNTNAAFDFAVLQ